MSEPSSSPLGDVSVVCRDEQKFWLSEEAAAELERDLFRELGRTEFHDPHHEYQTTTTLYFDGPGWPLLKETIANRENNEKLRARRYGYPAKGPVFAELKGKEGGETEKYRARVPAWALQSLCTGSTSPGQVELDDDEQKDNLKRFLREYRSVKAEPKLLVRYRRISYAKSKDAGRRATVDRGIVCARADGFEFNLEPEKWRPYHNPNQVLLELKSDGKPEDDAWVTSQIKRYDLTSVPHSKFRHAARELGVGVDAGPGDRHGFK